MGFKNFVVSKAMGAAAQEGLPEAQKLALKHGGRLFVFSDLSDIKEVFPESEVKLIVPSRFSQKILDEGEVFEIASKKKIFIVVGGSEPGLSKRDLEFGEAVALKYVEEEIGAEGFTSIILYLLRRKLKESLLG